MSCLLNGLSQRLDTETVAAFQAAHAKVEHSVDCLKSGRFKFCKIKEIADQVDTFYMEISPIVGIRITMVGKGRPIDPELTANFEIDALARTDDDTYSPGNRKADGAEEPEEDFDDWANSQESDRRADDPIRPAGKRSLSFFA